MTAYVVLIEVANEHETIWQAVEPAEVVEVGDPDYNAEAVSSDVATNQNAATGPGAWRVRVWESDDVGVTGTREADAETYEPADSAWQAG